MSRPSPAAVIVLAAGQGTRMKSALPKVLHEIGGRSLLGHVLAAGRALGPEHLAVVVRHQRDLVAAHLAELAQAWDEQIVVADQDEIPGTGRATQCALAALPADLEGPVLVLAGDVPLLDAATLEALLDSHVEDGNAVTILSLVPQDPTGYGRIVRDEAGDVVAIVEQKDATPEQAAIGEINSAVYVFDAAVLRRGLEGLGSTNAQGEVYLTDVIARAHAAGGHVRALILEDAILAEGVNDKSQLATLGAELNRRIVTGWMLSGVTIVDPATTWIDVEVTLEPDATVLPGTQLHGRTTVAAGAIVGPDTTLTDVAVAEGASVIRTHGSGAEIGPGASVGPFAYLRPGTVLGVEAKVGTFVETKNSTLGDGAKVPHLSYMGDATIGEGANVGGGSITANYDGVHKNKTVIGAHAKVGTDNMLVAPVTIGAGAYTGASTTVRRDVPPGALAVGGGGAQRTFEGWTLTRRPGTAAAQAAQQALDAAATTDEAPASGAADDVDPGSTR